MGNSLTVEAASGKWQKREKTKQRQNENSTLWCTAICCSCFIKISNRFISFPKSTITFSIFFTKTTISFTKPPFSITSITFSFSIPSNRITSYRITSNRISYRISSYRITCNRNNTNNNHNNDNNNNIWSIFIWISSSFYPICQHFGQVFSLKSALVIYVN